MTREELHRLIDELPEDRLPAVAGALRSDTLESGAQAQLAEAHRKLTAILDCIDESFSIVDRDCRVLYMNPVAEAGLKDVALTREGILGKVVWDVLPELVGTPAYDAAMRALAQGEPQTYELYYPPLDRWSEGRIYPSPEGLSSFSRDVTARKKFEQAVLKWQQVFDSVPWGLALADAGGGRIVDCNPAYARMHGYESPAAVVGLEVMSMFAPVVRRQQVADAEDVGEAGHKVYESLHVRRDGSVFPVLLDVAVIRDAAGVVRYRAAAVQDLSAQKLTEHRLQQQAEVLETVAMLGRMLNADLDLELMVQAVTDACTRLCGAEFGAFFYNRVDARGQDYLLYTLSGVPREAFSHFPMPRNTEVFGPTFRGEGVVRSDDITRDPRYGRNTPYHGMPPGHLPVRSYLAVPVKSRRGEVLGGLFFGHSQPGRFLAATESLIATVASQAAVAIESARLYETAVRERQEALVGRQAFRLMADHMPELMYTADASGRLDYLNQTFQAYAGLSLQDAQAADLSDLVHPEERPHTMAVWRDAFEAGQEWVVENRLRSAEGTYRWFLARCIPVRSEEGTIVKWLGTATDIEEQKQARLELERRSQALEASVAERRRVEAALQQAHDELESRVAARTRELEEANRRLTEMDRLKSQFISTMSHELRTPLNAIIGFSELLRMLPEQEVTTQERHEYIEHIASSGRLLLELVNDILDMARIEAGRLELDRQRVALGPVVEQAARIVKPLAEGKRITLGVDLMPAAEAWVDVSRLSQVLLNLLSNAIKFTPPGGHIEVNLKSEGEEVRVEVRDTGIGIDRADRDLVFEAFEQGRNARGVTTGTGLGLAISRRLVEAHRGRLELQSEPGKGSVFTVILPHDGEA